MATTATKLTLRVNYGSHPEVTKVYAYDVLTDTALVRLKYRRSPQLALAEYTSTGLQLIDAEGNYGNAHGLYDIKAELKRRALEVINDD